MNSPEDSTAPYYSLSYDKKGRFASYWHQIDEVISLQPQRILDIGIGNRFVSRYLRERGFSITSLDVDVRLKPDLCGSVLALPLQPHHFDLVTCFQVLEHLPYEKFTNALAEFGRLSCKHVLISVPDSSPLFRLWLQIPKIGDYIRLVPLPFKKRIRHTYDGHHYWHIGHRETPLKRVLSDIKKSGFGVVKNYRVFEFYHRILLLSAQQ